MQLLPKPNQDERFPQTEGLFCNYPTFPLHESSPTAQMYASSGLLSSAVDSLCNQLLISSNYMFAVWTLFNCRKKQTPACLPFELFRRHADLMQNSSTTEEVNDSKITEKLKAGTQNFTFLFNLSGRGFLNPQWVECYKVFNRFFCCFSLF